ncbi:hypothetical protein A8L34_28220 [Bacillus sp. FJAT-27264]|uniref:bifunctional lytic transglycosylase/C40 family peptidase n=1 Tax=Paenibacillus sp. (strain DSM 101736 / FJAT-27264) TaxID=1850362 RepID=UPI000807FFB3|nr:bifunctional lytic transglycosylase/C40 family peptidase [Bacillus sp. FJAT-27264]OBZ15935.1 hypothetical protein A8L34_28220 [Bacillus sp. FJAT-27264]
MILAAINPATIKLAIKGAGFVKEHLSKIIIILVTLIGCIFMLFTSVIAGLFSWTSWSDEDPIKIEPYQTYAAKYQLDYREVLAVDLGYHRLESDNLDINLVKKAFVYEVKVQVPVYKEITETKKYTTPDGKIIEKTETRTVIDHYETKTEIKTRSFIEAMNYLNMDQEQQDLAQEALSQMFDNPGGYIGGSAKVNGNVMAFEPLVRQQAIRRGIEDYVNIILAMIQQESSGLLLDVMQCSESLGLPRNSITDPAYSIEVGVEKFADRLRASNFDVKLALQGYNFGPYFITWAESRGGYSKENAVAFSRMMAEKSGNKGYGDVNYVDNVLRYVAGTGQQIFDVQKVIDIITPHLGAPYLFGGRSPYGGVDCSGLFEWAFAQMGMNFSGTAADMYNRTVPLASGESPIPGDFVFYETYRAGPSHLGMYVGNGRFLNSSTSRGVSYAEVKIWNNLKDAKFLGYRRWKN